MKNPIGWCDTTWNPMTGCTHVSEACEHCYAERMAKRFNRPDCESCLREQQSMNPMHEASKDECKDSWCGFDPFEPTFHRDRLQIPPHWRKPRRVFVCSMSDLFHEAFTDEQRDRVFATVAACPQHCFLVLTKRPEEMFRYMTDFGPGVDYRDVSVIPNLWLGVTVENQARADERIPILLDTPAAVRFVCCEPLLGAVDLVRGYQWARGCLTDHYKAPIDWVIVGGENGPGARQMQPEWALGVYRQCKAAGVPFWWKGPGAKGVGPYSKDDTDDAIDMMCCHELPSVQP